MRYHKLDLIGSFVDGPGGPRTVLWTQGCPVRCPGCQNKALWPEGGGREGSPFFLALRLAGANRPVTITGGEPFYQPEDLAAMLRYLRKMQPHVNIIVYTGYVLEDLLDMAQAIPAICDALESIDVLVDGPYLRDQDHDGLQWRGSANQRAIDLPETLEFGLGQGEIVTLDWNRPVLTLTPAGDVLGAAALLAPYMTLGELAETRRCGEVAPAGGGA